MNIDFYENRYEVPSNDVFLCDGEQVVELLSLIASHLAINDGAGVDDVLELCTNAIENSTTNLK